MGKVREVYKYTGTSVYPSIPLASQSSSIGTTLTNTSIVANKVVPLNDTKGNIVGKVIVNENVNNFENNNQGFLSNVVYLLDNGSYVMVLKWINNSVDGEPPSNTKYTEKAVSTGGKYAGKDVTVILKVGSDNNRKVILEYEK
jgi:hypothetical protein